jgi:pimeloyl-ACP methyl ester carboxylesterase
MARSSSGRPITFVVAGQRTSGTTRGAVDASPVAGRLRGRVKHSIRVGAQRGGAESVEAEAVPGEDVVVLQIANGPALVLHPQTARDLLLAQQSDSKRGTRAAGSSPERLAVPTRLGWPLGSPGGSSRSATRGRVGDVLLAGFEILTDLFGDAVRDGAAGFVASRIVERVDAQAVPGVYRLKPEGLSDLGSPFKQLPSAGGKPQLVFVHGTFSTISGTFAKLWTDHRERVGRLFEAYGRSNVYGFEHPTLGAGPIENALEIARTAGPNARLHLVTHSRGGLVAEVLARACAGAGALDGFDSGPDKRSRQSLDALAAVISKKKLKVERIVRVACPARGTLLSSKRLDAYVSVFQWALELAGVPVAPVIVDFLGRVAKHRADPDEIPGLAAQVPDSPLVRWLHDVSAPIPGSLRVVAGDLEGDSVTSWLKTLAADAFFWTDNDLVVHTRSMYGGAPREAASFLLDQGGRVSHFNYFSNPRTAAAVVDALTLDEPPGFRAIGPLSWAGESSTGVRAAKSKPDPGKPAVFVLPGILGSNLKVNDKRVWLGWRIVNGLGRLAYAPGRDSVLPDGPISFFYDDLARFLERTHDVIPFAFDWRRPIEDEARRLAAEVESALDARKSGSQPVRIVAHSMGGLVARAMQLERPDVWDRMMSPPGARLLMLGTPNGGSWAPMQVLSGDDTFGSMLTGFGAPFQDHDARELVAQFPGLLQLQANLLDETLNLGRHETWARIAHDDLESVRQRSPWHRLAIQLDAYRWGLPSQAVLDSAVSLRKRLDAQPGSVFAGLMGKVLLVTGTSPGTPDGYVIDGGEVLYRDIGDGDGRVTLRSALLPGVPTWKVDSEHGALPSDEKAFEAYLELLTTGSTDRLPQVAARPHSRSSVSAEGAGTPATSFTRPSRLEGPPQPPAGRGDVYARGQEPPPRGAAARRTALRVTVVNGDLTFIHHPLLIGHYRSSRLTGTERVMNRLIDDVMQDSLTAGMYPDLPGSHQVFLNAGVDRRNPWRRLPRPEAVVVAGLGEEGKLRPGELVRTVRQAVLAWAQRRADRPGGAPAVLELAATLLGSGGGLQVAQSAQLLVQGVREANERLADSRWPVIGHVHLIELYMNRASEAWRALQLQAQAAPGQYVVTETVHEGQGALARPLEDGYRGADYDFISALSRKSARGTAAIVYTLNTRRARSEVTEQTTQVSLIREMVANGATDRNRDAGIGETLFKLLVPLTLEPFFGDTTDMLLEVDDGTAGIPWELLDSGTPSGGDSRPWAIRCKLLRKLRTAVFRPQTTDAGAEASILVIGEPECDPALYPRLPGARAEARAVAACFGEGSEDGTSPRSGTAVKALISSEVAGEVGPDAKTVVGALLERDWRIIHVAGHGALPEVVDAVGGRECDPPPKRRGNPRGIVLSHCSFLGPSEIGAMRTVPELVFVNCCHLAARDQARLLREFRDPARFAASVADALIQVGVRCVVAAGWAVEDEAAAAFATTFYRSLLQGSRFADAASEARTAAHDRGGNTWAAYQCYGDPDWRLLDGAWTEAPPLAEEFSGIGSSRGLQNALETLAVKSKYQDAPRERQEEKIRHLEERFAGVWGEQGAIAEAFAVAWKEARGALRAIAWYEKAVHASDGTASLAATEQLANLRARVAWESVDRATRALAASRAASSASRKRGIARAQRALSAEVRRARASIAGAVQLLRNLLSIEPSIERENLLGSSYKRLAMVEAVAGRPKAERVAIQRARDHYERAEQNARASGSPDLFYPVMNRIAVEIALNAGKKGWKGVAAETIRVARAGAERRGRSDPDFWSVVGQTELKVYESLTEGSLAPHLRSLQLEYQDVHRRMSAPWLWSSVLDQLQFVLSGYERRQRDSESKAARALLDLLSQFVHGREDDVRR